MYSQGQWLWKGGGSWKPFEEAIGSNIELGFLQFRDHGGPHEVSISGTRVVDLRTLRQMRSEDRSRTRPVRRIALPTAAAPAVLAAASPALATSGTGTVHVAGRAPARVDVPQVQWMWSDGRGIWKPYDVTVSTTLENSHGEGKQTVDIDTERYVDLSSMYQCRRDDPRRRRKVRRDVVAATNGADGLPTVSSPSRNATPSKGVTVSNVAVDEPTATAARSASGTVSNSATEISTVDDISSSSMPPAAVNANAARVSAETDDDMDTKLKARMARFAAKRKRQESTAVGAAVTDLVSTSAHNSSLPASTCDSSSGAAASSSLMDKYTDGPGTLDLVGSNNDAAEASATLSLSLPTSSAYAAAGDSPDQQGSVKRKAGVQSSLSDFFNRSPVPVKQSSRPSVDPPGNHTDDSLSVLQASQSQHTGDDGFTSAPAPKKHRKLPGWMTGAEAKAGNRKNAQATTAHASPSSPPSQSSRLRGTDEDDLVYLGLRTPQKAASISAAASDSAASDSAAVRGERYSEGKSWNEIKEGFLDMLAALERSEKDKGDITRASAYSKAANAIRDHDGELVNGKEAKKLKGIGPKIAAKFDEFLEKGSLGRVERDRNDPRAVALQALNTVNGVGPVLAKKLLDENGIDSVAALVAALHSGKVSVNNDVRVGLKHYEDLLHRIPRNEVRCPDDGFAS